MNKLYKCLAKWINEPTSHLVPGGRVHHVQLSDHKTHKTHPMLNRYGDAGQTLSATPQSRSTVFMWC